MATHTVRVTFDEDDWEELEEHAPICLQDPEIVRHYVSLGYMFMLARTSGIERGSLTGFAPSEDGDADRDSSDE